MFYVDLQYVGRSDLVMPESFSLEVVEDYSQLRQDDLERMFDYLGKHRTEHHLRDRLEKGAKLWLLRVKHTLAAFIWSMRGNMVEPYFVPLTPDDAVLFDVETFPDYRGKGLYPFLVEYVFNELKKQNVVRVYGDAKTWNTPSLRGLAKTGFRHYADVRMVHVPGRTVTVWYANTNNQ